MILSDPQADIYESNQERNLFIAGQGSGKSHIGGLISYNFISRFPSVYGFIGANTDMQLTDSTLNRVFSVWEDFGIKEYNQENESGLYVVDKRPPAHFNTDGHNFRHYRNKISFINGCVIYIGSLENYKAHDGKEFGWAILDETKDTREEAVKEVIIGRLRQRGLYNRNGEQFNPLYILTSPAKVQWINDWFGLDRYESEIVASIYNYPDYFKKQYDNKLVTISSTYHNSANLPANFIESKKQDLPSNLVDMLVFANPFSRAGGEFYKAFDRMLHVADKAIPYDPETPLHLTFDFNVHPYMTLCIWQVYGKTAVQIDEICPASPKNSTAATCKEFVRQFTGHKAGVFVYGDPNGKSKDTRSEKDINDFSIIKKELRKYRPVMRVLNVAPSVSMRGNFINSILEKNYRGITLIFNPGCSNTIADYTYLKETHEGKKHKERVTDKQTGVSYEKYGHTSDANDYFICKLFFNELKAFIKGL